MQRNQVARAMILGALAAPSVHANLLEDMTIVASVSYQDKELSFDQRYTGEIINDNQAKFTANLPMVNFGLTAVSGKFFAVLKYETNLSDTSTTTSETDRSINTEANLLTLSGGTIDVGREDTSITFGYSVAEGINVFAGLLFGKTELTPDPFCADYFYQVPLTNDDINNGSVSVSCSRLNRAAQQFFLADQEFYSSVPRYKQTYEESGPFIGASYSMPIQDLGSLSFSFAYASMDGSYEDNAFDPDNLWAGNLQSFNYEGDSTGTSMAITWTSGLGDSSAYFIDIRRQAYSMTGDDVTGRLDGVKLKTDEEMLGITGGIQFYF